MIHVDAIYSDLISVREQSPLIHNITNFVVMNNTANALLAVGASPVMAHAVEEVEDMVNIASALVINMGTLSPQWVDAMLLAGEKARKKQVPIVFDPVGVGATSYRNSVANRIVEACQPTIIRGNASEIMALANENIITKGVDSTTSSHSALDSAQLLASQNNCVVVISGETDFITDGKEVVTIKNGSTLMPKVTGMGCTASALIGAFVGVHKNPLLAASHGMAIMGIAGEIAANKSQGPGTLQLNFLDVLYRLSESEIAQTFKS